jgi:nicotinamidase-related amidase
LIVSHPRVLDRHNSLLVVVDVQESYREVAFEFARVQRAIERLIGAAGILQIPLIATVQYPKGLGQMVAELASLLPAGTPMIEKLSISCCGAPAFAEALAAAARGQVVVTGLEAHACVNQTVHDLLAQGYQVHVPRDAISSRFEADYAVGWQKMIASGAVASSVEMACLEWVRTAAAPEFKLVQRLIK